MSVGVLIHIYAVFLEGDDVRSLIWSFIPLGFWVHTYRSYAELRDKVISDFEEILK